MKKKTYPLMLLILWFVNVAEAQPTPPILTCAQICQRAILHRTFAIDYYGNYSKNARQCEKTGNQAYCVEAERTLPLANDHGEQWQHYKIEAENRIPPCVCEQEIDGEYPPW